MWIPTSVLLAVQLLAVIPANARIVKRAKEDSWSDLRGDDDDGGNLANVSLPQGNLSSPFNPRTRGPYTEALPLTSYDLNSGPSLIAVWLSYLLHAWRLEQPQDLPYSQVWRNDPNPPSYIIVPTQVVLSRLPEGIVPPAWDTQDAGWGMLDALDKVFNSAPSDPPERRGARKPLWTSPKFKIQQSGRDLGTVETVTTPRGAEAANATAMANGTALEEEGAQGSQVLASETGPANLTSPSSENDGSTTRYGDLANQIGLVTNFHADTPMPQKAILMIITGIVTKKLYLTSYQTVAAIRPDFGRITIVAFPSSGWGGEIYLCHDRRAAPLDYATILEVTRRSIVQPMLNNQWAATSVVLTDNDFPHGFGVVRWGRLTSAGSIAGGVNSFRVNAGDEDDENGVPKICLRGQKPAPGDQVFARRK